MYTCVGCNSPIPWDGTGLFSYTCRCGATIFWNEETGQVALSASVIIGISKGQTLPHLDDLVGNSNFTSPKKTGVSNELAQKGFIWMRECEQCRTDGTLARRQAQEKYLIMQEAERIIKHS